MIDLGDNMAELKRRDSKPVKYTRVKQKRNRVKKVEGAAHNSGTLVLPTDKFGLTLDLRKAMLDVASRVGSDEAKAKLVMDTLKVLVEHMEARLSDNKSGALVLKPRRRTDNEVQEFDEDVQGQLALPAPEELKTAKKKQSKKKVK